MALQNILTLDIATITGWAVGNAEEKPLHGTIILPYKGENVGKPMAFLEDWLIPFIKVNNVQRVGYEAPFSQGKKQLDAYKMMALGATVEKVCYRLGIPCGKATPRNIKYFFTEDYYADKDEMIAMAEKIGFTPEDDNDADAIALWLYTLNFRYPRVFQELWGTIFITGAGMRR